jgi:hypothetical protein
MNNFFEDRPKLNIFDKIRLWWKFEGRYYHRDFVQGIKKLWYWFPIIWKDRDWDQHYIYEVIKHKLKAQAKYIANNDRHTRAQQDARNMRICVNLIKICQKETYKMEYMGYVKDRSWTEPHENNPEYSTWESEIISENFDDFFKKYPLIYKRVVNGEGPFKLKNKNRKQEKQRIAMNISHINQQRAHKLLFKILEQNIEQWWE